MQTHHPRTLSICVVVVAILHLWACDSADPSDDDQASPPAAGRTVVTPVRSPTSNEDETSAERSRRGVLHVDTYNCGIPDPAIDFAWRVNTHGVSATLEIHAGLTRLAIDEDGVLVATPELAASFNAKDGATRFEFRLREGLSFSNVQPLLARHVKWSWERALRKSTAPSRARSVLGSIVGADSVIDGNGGDLSGVKAVDDRLLTVELHEPLPDFPMQVSDPVASILEPANATIWDEVWINDAMSPSNTIAFTGLPLLSLPAGAGPFRLVEYIKPEETETSRGAPLQCILERNPYYWDPNLPRLQGIVATTYPYIWESTQDTSTRQRLELEAGTLDIAGFDENLSTPTNTLNDRAPVRVDETGSTVVRCLVLNPVKEPFTNRDVRAAFASAVPSTLGHVPPRASSIFPPSITTLELQHAPTDNQSHDIGEIATHDVQIDLYFHTLVLTDEVHELIVEAWQDSLGARVNWSEFRFDGDDPIPPSQSLQVAEVRIDNAVSQYNILKSILEAFGTEDQPPQFNELMNQLNAARHDLDTIRRQAKFHEIERTLLDQSLVIPIWADNWRIEQWLQPWVHGLNYPLPGGSYYRDVWFDESAPERTLPVP